jgi:hypothetical protein
MLTAHDMANVKARLISEWRAEGSGGESTRSITIPLGVENDMALKVGDPAPDFELPAVAGERQTTMRSRDYLGIKNLVVTFHPLDWTPT